MTWPEAFERAAFYLAYAIGVPLSLWVLLRGFYRMLALIAEVEPEPDPILKVIETIKQKPEPVERDL